MNSNISAARKLMQENRFVEAKSHLKENLHLLRENTKLRRRGDLVRIARTLAGLQMITTSLNESEQYWVLLGSEFRSVQDYLTSLGFTDYQELWNRIF